MGSEVGKERKRVRRGVFPSRPLPAVEGNSPWDRAGPDAHREHELPGSGGRPSPIRRVSLSVRYPPAHILQGTCLSAGGLLGVSPSEPTGKLQGGRWEVGSCGVVSTAGRVWP